LACCGGMSKDRFYTSNYHYENNLIGIPFVPIAIGIGVLRRYD